MRQLSFAVVTLSATLLAACAESAPPPRPPEAVTRSDPSLLDPDPDLAATESQSDGAESYTRRGWLGVEVGRSEEGGVVVRSVVPGSPAERAGLGAGDRIVRLSGVPVTSPDDVVRLVGARAPGTRMSVGVVRGDSERLFAANLAPAPDDSGVMKMTYVDRGAPTLEALDTVQGSVVPTLAGMRGKVVVLEFWAPWCAICRLLVSKLNAWEDHFASQGVVVMGVTMEPVVSAARASTELGIRYPVASDASGKTTVAYRANALPTLFVIDKRGVVRDVVVGYSSRRLADVETLMNRLVAEP